jgi:hypothetical protein
MTLCVLLFAFAADTSRRTPQSLIFEFMIWRLRHVSLTQPNDSTRSLFLSADYAQICRTLCGANRKGVAFFGTNLIHRSRFIVTHGHVDHALDAVHIANRVVM